MSSEITKEYSNGELTIVWKPGQCIHSGVCVKTLPKVYKPNEKPWIQPEVTPTSELKAQIDKCPSGALSYYMNQESPEPESTKEHIRIEVSSGPLMVYGSVKITKLDGSVEVREKTTAFCRCGASMNKPYCDGTHNKIGFSE